MIEDGNGLGLSNQELIERYPFLQTEDWEGNPIDDYTYLNYMPYGWRKAFGIQLCEELKNELEKYDYVDKFKIVQVREKFGQLRVYHNGVPYGCNVDSIIDKYTDISETTCILCGNKATLLSKGWISPLCDCIKNKEWYREEEYAPISILGGN